MKEVTKLLIAFSYSWLDCRASNIFSVGQGGEHWPMALPSCQHS